MSLFRSTACACGLVLAAGSAQAQYLAVFVDNSAGLTEFDVSARLVDADRFTTDDISVVALFDFVVHASALSSIDIDPTYRSTVFGFTADASTGEMSGQSDYPPLAPSHVNENPTRLGGFTLAAGASFDRLEIRYLDGVVETGGLFPVPVFYERGAAGQGVPGFDLPYLVVNGPDLPTPCAPDGPFTDCNGNGIPDQCDLLLTFADTIDCDGNGEIDSCQVIDDPMSDCNANGIVDSCEILQNPALDCDGDGQIDSCQVVLDPSSDCDGDRIVDSCLIAIFPSLDCDDNELLDSCEIDADPSLDCDMDGTIDTCQIASAPQLDCNDNGLLDACEIAADPSLDCNQDGELDACQLISQPSFFDCDGDGSIDSCQVTDDPTLDLDENGRPDECAPGGSVCIAADVNGDGQFNGADFNAWLTAYGLGQRIADQNRNGEIEPSDFNAWLAAFNTAETSCP